MPTQPARASTAKGHKATGARRLVWIGTGIVAILVGVATTLFILPDNNNLTSLPLLVRTEWERPLSDGKTLTNWTGIRGTWHFTGNEEGAPVLEGNGSIDRTIPQPDFPRPREMPNYGVGIAVYLNAATEVELQFWDVGTGIVHSLHLSSEGAAVGRRVGDQDLEVTSKRIAAPAEASDGSPKYRELRVERHEGFWLAFFANQLVGRIPATGQASRTIRLVAKHGAAHFDDLHVFEMVPANDSP